MTLRIRKMKVNAAVQRQMDTVTHAGTEKRKLWQAGGWLQIKKPSETGGKREIKRFSVSLCVRLHVFVQKYVDTQATPHGRGR